MNRKLKKGLYWGANIFLPLSETRLIGRTLGTMLGKNLQRTRRLCGIGKTTPPPEKTYHEALADSRWPEETLINRYTVTKRTWLGFAAVGAIVECDALLVFFLHPQFWSVGAVVRMSCITLMAIAFITLFFFRGMVCQFRLWQLQHHRVSTAEKGTFTDFRRETDSIRLTLGLRPRARPTSAIIRR
ncbi:TPA: conjugal transfer protein TraX [Salmonella enterica]|nr:conjugal transfer protein TraX [Salmonella enterica]